MNSINCIVKLFTGATRGFDWYDNPLIYKMSGLNLMLQWHLCCTHVHGSNHGGIVFFGGLLLNIPIFMRMWHLYFLDETNNFLRAQTALSCLLVRRACMWLCLHFKSMYNHVSCYSELHMEHVIGDMLLWQRIIVF